MTMQTTARALSAALQADTRDDGTQFFKLVDGSPQWMLDAVREAHDGRLPNDTDYSMISEVADAILEALLDDPDADLDEARHERVDGLVDIYNADLLRWVSGHMDYAGYVNEAQEEGVIAPDDDFFRRLTLGQYRQYDGIWTVLVEAIEAQAEDEEDAE